MERSDFLKKAGFTGACFCGLCGVTGFAGKPEPPAEVNLNLNQKWLSTLISSLEKDLDEEVVREIVKKSAATHYDELKMSAMLADYIGDLEKFITFIEGEWGWKIQYDKAARVLIADENKSYCVCPVLKHTPESDNPAICYCSEGFAEKMFGVVAGAPVKARVIASVRKGDATCKYRIEL